MSRCRRLLQTVAGWLDSLGQPGLARQVRVWLEDDELEGLPQPRVAIQECRCELCNRLRLAVWHAALTGDFSKLDALTKEGRERRPN